MEENPANAPLILLVEDDQEVLGFNERKLLRRGCNVITAQTLGIARSLLTVHRPDLIVLDVMLPDGNGFEFCSQMRQTSDVPVLFLTGKTDVRDKVEGLSDGGDYYLTKPYDYDEFAAVVDSLLRRSARAEKSRSLVSKGPLTLDIMSSRAFMHNTDLLLSPKEFALLHFFVLHEGQVLSFDLIFETIWHMPLAGNLAALQRAVSKLRNKLQNVGAIVDIQIHRGSGYEFILNG
ncbi:MAG: response regulator transcription factor [Clostridiales bacterium]|nr:response regulator transcription factor [Clostridiales bacterium]